MNWSRPWALVLSTIFFLVGCRTAAPATFQGPGLNAQRESNLMAKASTDLNCPSASLTGRYLESYASNVHVYRVEGCKGRYDALLECAGVCIWIETPEKRASFDLQCPREELQRTYLGRGTNFSEFTLGIAGCGRTITYLYFRGQWIANAASR